jgi:hypothetical protein
MAKRWKVYRPAEQDPMVGYALMKIERQYGHRCAVNRKDLEKFGGNPNVGTSIVPVNSWGTAETLQTSNVTLKASSSSTSDVGVKVYLEAMELVGTDFHFRTTSFTLNGQSKVDLPAAYARWTRAYTYQNVVGDVWLYRDTAITSGVPTDKTFVHLQIPSATNQSQKAATTIAYNNYFLLFNYWADVVKKASVSVGLYLDVAEPGQAFRTQPRRGLGSSFGLDHHYKSPRIILPNSDIRIRAVSTATATDVTAGFFGMFADIYERNI